MSGDLTEGMESSRGDPRVLFVLNAVLSLTFAYIVLYLTSLVGFTTFGWDRVLALALGLMVLTFVVTRSS